MTEATARALLDDVLRRWMTVRTEADLGAVRTQLRRALQCPATVADATPDEAAAGWARLILLLVQDGATTSQAEARSLLVEQGFQVLLSPAVLSRECFSAAAGQPCPPVLQAAPSGENHCKRPPVFAVDDALPQPVIKELQRVFARGSRFWADHSYEDPATGYFSYAVEQTPQCIPLQGSRRSDVSQEQEGGDLITMTIEHIKDAVAEMFPAVRRCHTAEWWAQWKPHHAGHELHFDSVFDTGSETVLTPIVSTVLYLSAAVGGSTLVTDQSLDSKKMANEGWLCDPRENRLLFFGGDLLHGVVPPKGPPPVDGQVRITFMVAFWQHPLPVNEFEEEDDERVTGKKREEKRRKHAHDQPQTVGVHNGHGAPSTAARKPRGGMSYPPPPHLAPWLSLVELPKFPFADGVCGGRGRGYRGGGGGNTEILNVKPLWVAVSDHFNMKDRGGGVRGDGGGGGEGGGGGGGLTTDLISGAANEGDRESAPLQQTDSKSVVIPSLPPPPTAAACAASLPLLPMSECFQGVTQWRPSSYNVTSSGKV